MLNFQTQSLRSLPRRPEQTWQGTLFQLPAIRDETGRGLIRPWAALWLAVGGQALPYFPPEELDERRSPATLWQGLVQFATHPDYGGYLPGRIEVREPDLAPILREHLAGLGLEVALVDKLSDVDQLLGGLQDGLAQPSPVNRAPGILTAPGVTLGDVRLFAEAAAAFYRAAPWQHLEDVDLLAIETPPPPEGMRHVSVLGAGGQTFGLGFHHDPEDCYDMLRKGDRESWLGNLKYGLWQCTFDDAALTPLADVQTWEEHQLPLASDDAYPAVLEYRVSNSGGKSGPTIARAEGPRLAFVEGLFRVLAQTTEAQMDSGRWSLTVPTAAGPMTFTLALPDVLHPPTFQTFMKRGHPPDRRATERLNTQVQRFLDGRPGLEDMDEINDAIQREFIGKVPDPAKYPPRNALERATDLCFEAIDAKGRRQLQLVRQALAACPDCAEAYVLLAERQSDSAKAAELYARGVAAGERSLGPERFTEDAGNFWGQLDTRPYMRARLGLAESLASLDRLPEAVDHYRELLRLNPEDNQGVRYLYLPALLELGEDAEAARYMQQSPPDPSAGRAYTRALLAFRLGGDDPSARQELAKALKVNPAVPEILLSGDDEGPLPDSYAPGSVEEAILCAAELADAFTTTPGALDWLDTASEELAKAAAPRKFKQRKRRSR